MFKPEIQCGLKIYFNNNYDVNEITNVLGVKPTSAVNYDDAGYTKKTSLKCSGYWWYMIPGSMDYKEYWNVDDVLTELFSFFSKEKIKWLKECLQEHDGEISIDMNIFVEDDFPELCFYGQNMRIINDLGADINLNINREVKDVD